MDRFLLKLWRAFSFIQGHMIRFMGGPKMEVVTPHDFALMIRTETTEYMFVMLMLLC